MAKHSSRRSSRSPKSFIISLLLVIGLLLTAYFQPELLQELLGNSSDLSDIEYAPQADRSHEIPGKLQVHFFDVGQGDATLIITPDEKTILIDAGPNSKQDQLLGYLDALGVDRLDFLIFTHPHEDHIGGGDVVVQTRDVGRILMPDFSSSSSTFTKLLTVIEEKDIEIEPVEHGNVYTLSECKFTIYGPISITEKDANNASIVLRLVYGSTSFLFSGDAEEKAEEEVLGLYANNLRSDVYQVGHHGSNTSSSINFVEKISPSIAVFSCGKDNEYGHPHEEIITRLHDLGATLYRTDLQGSILLLSDGKTVT